MKKMMYKIILMLGCLMSLNAVGQDSELSQELLDRYYSDSIEVGVFDASLDDSLKLANAAQPLRFYMICGAFIENGMMNEAAVAFYIGRNRYKIYNKTNPDYEASGDGALAGSFAYLYGEVINEHLTKNLNNYREVIQKCGDWYKDNKHFYFDNADNDSLYQVQINAILEFADMLLNNPLEYINQLESQRKELEELLEEINIENVYSSSEEGINETNYRPTSEIPQAFFTNYNFDHFKVGVENEVSAVAHGWYDTYLESDDADIIQSEVNSLQYQIIPFRTGICTIKLFGVRKDGFTFQLATYGITVSE